MAAITTSLSIRPAVCRAPSETASHRREADFSSADAPAPPDEMQFFGDADYHLLRSHALLARLQQAISAKAEE